MKSEFFTSYRHFKIERQMQLRSGTEERMKSKMKYPKAGRLALHR